MLRIESPDGRTLPALCAAHPNLYCALPVVPASFLVLTWHVVRTT
jgi:hypothetical protein